MTKLRIHFSCAAALMLGLLAAAPAHAASLQKVDNWGASGVPSTTSMYIYVPDNLAPNPPILVVAHYCGGTAGNVFGQAQGGGIVSAADQNGFIIVVPQTTNNCWDVGSTASLTHDGGGETQAVAQMVQYTIEQYQANADRVYITGDSSGAMMTQAMLAVYPDVFKGGSAFAGVPAGCWAVGNPDGSWSSQCAGGQVTHTPQEWGDLVRAMYPGYDGHRPRVQLFHGDGDSTLDYQNHLEAIKEWTDVLGLSTDPTSTDTVTLGSHQAKRERWENSCGYVVLEAYTSMGGDHGPSDAIFDASFVVPFLALDNTDAVDPEIAQCGDDSMGGVGGMGGTTTGTVGTSAGGVSNTSGTTTSTSTTTDGTASDTVSGTTGGTTTSTGATAGSITGSATVSGTTGGSMTVGGTSDASTTSTSGASSTGGASAVGTASTGAAGPVGGESAAPAESGDSNGCSCSVVGDKKPFPLKLPFAFVALLVLGWRRVPSVSESRGQSHG